LKTEVVNSYNGCVATNLFSIERVILKILSVTRFTNNNKIILKYGFFRLLKMVILKF